MQAKKDDTVISAAAAQDAEAQKALAKQQDEIRRKRKALGDKPNAAVAQALQITAERDYKSSGYLWCGFYKLDQFQAALTGVALTENTQKTLDAEVLSKDSTAPRHS